MQSSYFGVDGASSSRVITHIAATTTPVVSTTGETTVFSLTLPAGLVSTGDVLRLHAAGDLLNNSGGAATDIFRLKIGTTTVLANAGVPMSQAANASRRNWILDATFTIESATAQRVDAKLEVSDSTTDTWTAMATVARMLTGQSTAAEDTSTAKAILFTDQKSVSAATVDTRIHSASLIYVKKAAA